MPKIAQAYGIGQALIPVLPPPILFESAPTSNQTNYSVGQVVYIGTPGAYTFYIYAGAGVWELLDISTGTLSTLTGDTGTATPSGGNINLAGTAAQVATTASGSTVTLSLIGPYTPASYTAHTVLLGEGASSIGHTTTGSAGQLLTSGGVSADPTWTTATFPATATSTGTILRSNGTNWVASTDTYPNTVTAGDILIATATNVVGSLADVAVGQALMSGGVGVAPAYSGSPSFSGSVTAGTGLTATTGNITTSAVAAGFVTVPTVTSGAASGTVNCNGRVGAVSFTSPSIAGGATLTLTVGNTAVTGSGTVIQYSVVGATTGAALNIQSVTNSAGSSAVVIENGTGATTQTGTITLVFIVLN